jgi:hypothetical protein
MLVGSRRGSVGMADEHDLGSCAARRGGSNPPFPIRTMENLRSNYRLDCRLSSD